MHKHETRNVFYYSILMVNETPDIWNFCLVGQDLHVTELTVNPSILCFLYCRYIFRNIELAGFYDPQ